MLLAEVNGPTSSAVMFPTSLTQVLMTVAAVEGSYGAVQTEWDSRQELTHINIIMIVGIAYLSHSSSKFTLNRIPDTAL